MSPLLFASVTAFLMWSALGVSDRLNAQCRRDLAEDQQKGRVAMIFEVKLFKSTGDKIIGA